MKVVPHEKWRYYIFDEERPGNVTFLKSQNKDLLHDISVVTLQGFNIAMTPPEGLYPPGSSNRCR